MKRILLLLFLAAISHAATITDIANWVEHGQWQQARLAILENLQQTNLGFQARQDLLFQQDRMGRMRLDFNKTREQALQDARKVVPSVTEEQFAAWEKAGAVEFLDVGGDRWYFHSAGANVFRINPEARELKRKANVPTNDLYRREEVQQTIATTLKTGATHNSAKTWRVTYSVSVKPGMVPAGEIIRAWLPFPQSGNRQSNVRLIASEPKQFIASPGDAALSSLYFEKPAASNGPTEFKVVFEYTADAFYQPIDPARIQAVDENNSALAHFLGEQPPHIIFKDEIKKLSQEIVGSETNPYRKARKIFAWVYENVPWASAREYSTLDCLPSYALGCRHGDCGIKTMTFMTLCRLNGIPARWETGWTPAPVEDMHDWCEIYLAPYGWVPADATYGLVDSADEREKWFFLGGIDAGRLVLNNDYNQPLYPTKMFYRSEIVDFQRGELEWRGGNLYFNQWNWDFKAEEIKKP